MTQIALASIAAVSGCATTEVPLACTLVARSQGEPFGRYERSAPRDLGRGITASDISSYARHSAGAIRFLEQTELVDCRTGDAIILTRASRSGAPDTLVDQRDDVAAALMGPDATVPTIADLAAALNVPFRMSVSDDRAACGCNLFYPELRGSKTEYEGLQ